MQSTVFVSGWPLSTSLPGSTSPTDCTCNTGLYSDNSECKSCPLNSQLKFGTTKGTSSTACICNKNYYSERSGDQMTCNKCQSSSTSPPGSTSPTDCLCDQGSYLLKGTCVFCDDDQYLNNTSPFQTAWRCVQCPKGASCKGHVNTTGVRSLFGWARCPNLHLNFTKCVYPGACFGAPNPTLEGQFMAKAAVNNNESCAHELGHRNTPNTNLRCSSCSLGFVPVKETGECRKCGTSGESTALISIAAFAAIILFVVLIALKMKSSGKKKGEHSTIKRTLLTHLQMVTIVMSLAVPWPSAVRVTMTFVSSLTSISSHSSSIHCSLNDGKGIFYGVLLCSVLLPLFM